MKIILGVTIVMAAPSYAQTAIRPSPDYAEQGIHFNLDDKWNMILSEAKAENKYIFIDCYTTWCGPCKEMEKSVYPVKKVGDLFNDKFISVKMQMDTTSKDDVYIRERYLDADYVRRKFAVDVYPTFLFFTPDGKIINRDFGAKTPDDFCALGEDVLNPGKDYYKLLQKYKLGKRDFDEMSYLARMGKRLGDNSNEQEIASVNISQLARQSIFTKENVRFVHDFTNSTKDQGFSWVYNHADTIDVVMGDDTYSQQFLQGIIYKEVVVPELDRLKEFPNSVPDWENLQNLIEKQYNRYYSDRVIIGAKATWALEHKKKQEYTKYLVLFQDRFGSKSNNDFMTSLNLNNYAWAIFLYSSDIGELERALSWSSRAVMMFPTTNWIDTYANILYKLGRAREAVSWEEIAGKLSPDDNEIQTTLIKMKGGLEAGKGRQLN